MPVQDDEMIRFINTLLNKLIFIHGKKLTNMDIKIENILQKGKLFKLDDLGLFSRYFI